MKENRKKDKLSSNAPPNLPDAPPNLPKAPPNLPKGEASDNYRYETANPKTYAFTKRMKQLMIDNPTKAEKLMWDQLKAKKIGFKIRRQHIIEDFIVDFVCIAKKVVIEIDGKIHLKTQTYDKLRSARLIELGYAVIRFTNEEVIADPVQVSQKIRTYLEEKRT